MRKEPDFLLQFTYAKLIETISNAKLYAFDEAFPHITQLREDTHAFRVQSIKKRWIYNIICNIYYIFNNYSKRNNKVCIIYPFENSVQNKLL